MRIKKYFIQHTHAYGNTIYDFECEHDDLLSAINDVSAGLYSDKNGVTAPLRRLAELLHIDYDCERDETLELFDFPDTEVPYLMDAEINFILNG